MHDYQRRMIDFALSRTDVIDKGAAMLCTPGLGKTRAALEWLTSLEGRKLVVAPLRVCVTTWPEENERWGFDLRISIVHGTPKQRNKALETDADLFVINPANLKWLVETGHRFDVIVFDESSQFRNATAQRSRAAQKLARAAQHTLILTGTPTPKSAADLYGQMLLIDGGRTLGRTLTEFRRRYCHRGGYKDYEWFINDGADEAIREAIRPLAMSLGDEQLELPEFVVNRVPVILPCRKEYESLEKDLFASVGEGEMLLTNNAYAACRQVCNGGLYQSNPVDGHRWVEELHTAKVEALAELHQEIGKTPLLTAYLFDHDRERLQATFDAPAINGDTSMSETVDLVKRWNNGDLPMLLVQPQALSHGANLQHGGSHIAWFGLTDDLEIYEQFNRRLYRQGQRHTVHVHQLVCVNTIEIAVRRRLEKKGASQRALLEALNEYRNGLR